MRYRYYIYLFWLTPIFALAADFESSLQSLVSSVVGRILPILALGYVGKNIFGHIQGDPNAKKDTANIAIAVVALLGINGVWQWLKGQVK
jgi:hypothetical protein